MKTLNILAPALLLAALAGGAQAQTPAANKAVVLNLYREVFEAQSTANAAKYIAPGYIQHNPNVPGGLAGFVGAFGPRWTPKPVEPALRNPPAAIVAEGDLVQVMFERNTPEPSDPAKTYKSYWFDLYRVKDGKVVEHWDGAFKPVPKP